MLCVWPIWRSSDSRLITCLSFSTSSIVNSEDFCFCLSKTNKGEYNIFTKKKKKSFDHAHGLTGAVGWLIGRERSRHPVYLYQSSIALSFASSSFTSVFPFYFRFILRAPSCYYTWLKNNKKEMIRRLVALLFHTQPNTRKMSELFFLLNLKSGDLTLISRIIILTRNYNLISWHSDQTIE